MFISRAKIPCRPLIAALPLIGLLLLPGCATSPQGRTQLTAPSAVSEVYSEVDVQLSLATAGKGEDCRDDACTLNREFDHQVARTGGRLTRAAHVLFDGRVEEVPQFSFEVADKDKLATASNAEGKIVVMRGVQTLQLDDAGLGFLMAREMGRVLGRHHDENTGTRILVSVLAGVLFPASGLFSAGSAATQATATSSIFSSTAVGAAAASTATSMFGSKLILDSLRPKQISEADYIAAHLTEQAGWPLETVSAALTAAPLPEGEDIWARDYRATQGRIAAWVNDAQATQLAMQRAAENERLALLPAPDAWTDSADDASGTATAQAAEPAATMELAAPMEPLAPVQPALPMQLAAAETTLTRDTAIVQDTATLADSPIQTTKPAVAETEIAANPPPVPDTSTSQASAASQETRAALTTADQKTPVVAVAQAPEAAPAALLVMETSLNAPTGTAIDNEADAAAAAEDRLVLEPAKAIVAQGMKAGPVKSASLKRKPAAQAKKSSGATRLAAKQAGKSRSSVKTAALKPRGKSPKQRLAAQSSSSGRATGAFSSRIKPSAKTHRTPVSVKHHPAKPTL